MKKKHIIMALVLMFTMGLNTACKFESKSSESVSGATPLAEKSGQSVTALDVAVAAEARLKAATSDLEKAEEQAVEARARKATLQEACQAETNPHFIKAIFDDIGDAEEEVKSLDDKIAILTKLVEDRGSLLGQAKDLLTEEEKGQIETGVIVSDSRANIKELMGSLEVRHNVQAELIENQRIIIGSIIDEIQALSDEKANWEASGAPGAESLINTLSGEIEELNKKKEDAEAQLRLMGLMVESMASDLGKNI